ncbi:NAD(P)-dependent oxidoreductase [Mesorhizobium sp.]|uniref:NAD(P)-dependent oxidoreductase n=1 Tax=Mesorhizobium sp. TaxID=1871066 RepID=UPI000FEA964E|nr:NAD(P)-dependent oxidoreductase [Mesorhizobium sp.]RWB67045.1 MAG: phosphoglycerate dehydrogenase [Mesorhizobium sp.]RWB82539.1 MAG: phosphoglycerate dehydrogenase [Mesorhizobium sp.]
MVTIAEMKEQLARENTITRSGPPKAPSNPFFGVGPITDATIDEVAGRLRRVEFDAWLEANYRKLDDKGNDLGPFTTAEIARSMHRGYPADKILTDMMGSIHQYFEFPKQNLMAVGLGGGHSGFTVAVMHLMNPNNANQRVYVDTTKPEASESHGAGFFRQSWATQLLELQKFAQNGSADKIQFATVEGSIPTAKELEALGTTLFLGVGHETTGANTYSKSEIEELLKWLDRDPDNRHAVLDATSMLGAMPWGEAVVREALAKCCVFMPFQKAIGGISGYFVVSFTPQALKLVESNQNDPAWAIPRQLKLAPPVDAKLPVSGKRSLTIGPFYDAEQQRMLGGVINTYSALAFAETTFGLLQAARRVGSVSDLNRRSVENRRVISEWVDNNSLLKFTVSEAEKRGAAVVLLKVVDPDIADKQIHARIIARSKQLLGYEGITHVNGDHEKGLDAARYVNAFPGMPGDYRAWIGGIRDPEDVRLLLDNLAYAYRRAKVAVLEEELAAQGERFESAPSAAGLVRKDDPERAYTVLIADLLGLRLGENNAPDSSEIAAYIREKGGEFHLGALQDRNALQKGKIHFFYQPGLSTEAELLGCTAQGEYDALIAAATFIPKQSVFPLGGVRIGAGTGNMGSSSWGGPDGDGGVAPLMNTPGINSRATAQMAMKALLKVVPNIPVDELHERTVAGKFDTGRNLKDFPTSKLEGQKLAVLGYGNIGREVAKLASAFGMRVCVYAREAHRAWIEAEGFEYADSPVKAAKDANVLSVHVGLGRLDKSTGKFSNAGFVDRDVLSSLADGAVLINYDRGELVDIEALDAALQSGKVSHVAVDADIFSDAKDGTLRGPLTPYLPLSERHPGRLELLPHVAADTDHPTRVAGAKQAVDQIYDAIQFKAVRNLKGALPEGYVNLGSTAPVGVGKSTSANLGALADQSEQWKALRQLSERIAAVIGGIDATTDPERRATLVSRYHSELALDLLNHRRILEGAGLFAPAVA